MFVCLSLSISFKEALGTTESKWKKSLCSLFCMGANANMITDLLVKSCNKKMESVSTKTAEIEHSSLSPNMMENAFKTWNAIAPTVYFDWTIRIYFQGSVKGIKQTTSINSNVRVLITAGNKEQTVFPYLSVCTLLKWTHYKKHVNIFK